MAFSYEYPRANLAVDIVVFGYQPEIEGLHSLSLLLIQRGLEPFRGQWALPGGFVHIDEDLEQAARRELKEEAGLDNIFLEQLYTFGRVDRDPRERVVSCAYYALVEQSKFKPKAATDAADAKWYPLRKLPKLAFDHAEIVKTADERLRNKVRYEPVGFELLPKQFTLGQLQSLYESILETELDKRNFRKKVLAYGVLKELDRKTENQPHRPSSLYSFDSAKYKSLMKKGLKFDL